ncbi:T9SS type A sorting domain-containing protein [Chitinophagales bacterium]|nr:T9SS type A sorting domain-containing protein [Chitinophagales bacterium]
MKTIQTNMMTLVLLCANLFALALVAQPDCNGVVGGTAVEDFCWQCLELDDPTYNECVDSTLILGVCPNTNVQLSLGEPGDEQSYNVVLIYGDSTAEIVTNDDFSQYIDINVGNIPEGESRSLIYQFTEWDFEVLEVVLLGVWHVELKNTCQPTIPCTEPLVGNALNSLIAGIGSGQSIDLMTANGEYYYRTSFCDPIPPDGADAIFDCTGTIICDLNPNSEVQDCDTFGTEFEFVSEVWDNCGIEDCAGTLGGTFVIDNCGNCSPIDGQGNCDQLQDLFICVGETAVISLGDLVPFSIDPEPQFGTWWLSDSQVVGGTDFNYTADDFVGNDAFTLTYFDPVEQDQITSIINYTIIVDACNDDCEGIPGGTAVIDECGVCLQPDDLAFNSCVEYIHVNICQGDDYTYEYGELGDEEYLEISQDGYYGMGIITVDGFDQSFYFLIDPDVSGVTDTVVIMNLDLMPESIYAVHYFIFNIEDCSQGDIWPGDANNDGVANNIDIPHIGIKFGSQGQARPNASSDWEAQFGFDWEFNVAGINGKYVDCDGQGSIDFEDVIVVGTNYDLTHGKEGSDIESGPPIYLELPAVVFPGQLVEVPIWIGTEDEQVEDFYGAAFSIELDPDFIDSESLQFNFDMQWLGDEQIEQVSLVKPLLDNGRIDVGITRINQIGKTGYGQIGTLSYVMNDDIIGKSGLPLMLSITNVYALNKDGIEMELSGSENETEVSTGLTTTQALGWSMYPNPVEDRLFIERPTAEELLVRIYAIDGSLLLEQRNEGQMSAILLQELPSGLYIVEMLSSEGTAIEKIQLK